MILHGLPSLSWPGVWDSSHSALSPSEITSCQDTALASGWTSAARAWPELGTHDSELACLLPSTHEALSTVPTAQGYTRLQ